MIDDQQLLERVAEAIYRNEGGITDEECIEVLGEARRAWKTDKPWDSDPEHELCEHERDEYRAQAKAAIQVILESLGSQRTEPSGQDSPHPVETGESNTE